jgi:hypothetical protein
MDLVRGTFIQRKAVTSEIMLIFFYFSVESAKQLWGKTVFSFWQLRYWYASKGRLR